jgi:hypothetical protein
MGAHLARYQEECPDAVAEVLGPRSTGRRRKSVVSDRSRDRIKACAKELPAEGGQEEHPSRMISAGYEGLHPPDGVKGATPGGKTSPQFARFG